MNQTVRWTTPYYGITHCGELSHTIARVSVIDRGTFAELHQWFPDCGFSPTELTFYGANCVTRAKTAAIAWLKQQTGWNIP